MNYLGDFADNATLDFKWSSNAADGSSITRATNGTISVYIGNGATQVTAGVTDTEDFDSTTGVHHCRIDLSADAAYAVGSECQVVLTGATIDGQTVNAVLAHFSIERAGGVLALLKGANGVAAIKTQTDAIQAKTDNLPADPADQSLIIAATDAVMARLGAPVGASMSADVAAVKAQTAAIETDTQDLQARTPAALVGGRMDASVGAMAAGVITAAATAADFTTEQQAGLATAAVAAAIQAKTDNLPSDPADASVVAAATDAIIAAVATRLASAAYTAPLDAAGTRAAVGLSAANLEDLLAVIDTVVDAIKAKTDSLTFTSTRVHADTKAVAGVVLEENGSGTQSIGGPA